jgi:hypothetical protein
MFILMDCHSQPAIQDSVVITDQGDVIGDEDISGSGIVHLHDKSWKPAAEKNTSEEIKVQLSAQVGEINAMNYGNVFSFKRHKVALIPDPAVENAVLRLEVQKKRRVFSI